MVQVKFSDILHFTPNDITAFNILYYIVSHDVGRLQKELPSIETFDFIPNDKVVKSLSIMTGLDADFFEKSTPFIAALTVASRADNNVTSHCIINELIKPRNNANTDAVMNELPQIAKKLSNSMVVHVCSFLQTSRVSIDINVIVASLSGSRVKPQVCQYGVTPQLLHMLRDDEPTLLEIAACVPLENNLWLQQHLWSSFLKVLIDTIEWYEDDEDDDDDIYALNIPDSFRQDALMTRTKLSKILNVIDADLTDDETDMAKLMDKFLEHRVNFDYQGVHSKGTLLMTVLNFNITLSQQHLHALIANTNVTLRNTWGETALYLIHGIWLRDDFPISRALVQHGADVNAITNDRNTPLLDAIDDEYDPAYVPWLLQNGATATIDHHDQNGSTALILAAMNVKKHIEPLLQFGADPNIQNLNGETALMHACDDAVAVKALIDAGADVYAKDADGDTILMYAALEGNINVIHLILDQMDLFDVTEMMVTNITKSFRRSCNNTRDNTFDALANRVQQHHDQVLRFLETIHPLYCQNNVGSTALMEAVRKGHNAVAEALLKAGASVHQINNDGETALMMAVNNRHISMIEELLRAGSDIHHTNNDGDTAFMMSIMKGVDSVAEVLLNAGARLPPLK